MPERQRFATLPLELEGWDYEVQPINPTVADVLGADDSIVANFTKAEEGEMFNLYLAYLEARRDGRSWHSPRQCIPGGGWQIMSHTIEEATSADGRTYKFNRLLIQHGEYRQLVYYWYDHRSRRLANEFEMRFWVLWDAIFKKRTDGALVRLIAPIRKDQAPAEADAFLRGIALELDEHMADYVPL